MENCKEFERLTVGELKKLLSNVPDSYIVYVSGAAEGGYACVYGKTTKIYTETYNDEVRIVLDTDEEC